MVYNIKDFGAVADGSTLCTESIQKAIDTCHKNGGGRVVIPAGEFVTGTVLLKDHVELHLEIGALLLASTNMDDYNKEDAYVQNFGSAIEEWRGTHLILAVECEDVAVTGLGVIDGRGDFFFEEPREYPGMNGYRWRYGMSKARNKEILRPGQLMCFIESRNVVVEDITMRNCTCWSCFLHGCEYVNVRGIKVFNGKTAANTDGVDIDCCRFVTVSDCIIDTGDDAITVRCDTARLKNKQMLSEYITVTNCNLSVSASAFRIGVGIGTIRHVRVSNVTIERAGTAIHFMTSYWKQGEAHIEDVNFRNISAYNVGSPIEMSAGVGSIRRVTLDNMRFYGMAQTAFVSSDSGEISDIVLRNLDIHVIFGTDGTIEKRLEKRGTHILKMKNIRGAVLDGVRVFAEDGVMKEWEGALYNDECEDVEIRNCSF